jgi:hypothetical protein
VIPTELKWDFALWVAFFFGEMVFVLKRASMAARSATNHTPSRWAYFKANLDLIAVRTVLEFIFIYYPFRHFGVSWLLGIFGWHPTVPIQGGFVTSLALGYLSDSMLDWIGTQPWVPNLLKETIPLVG